MSEGTKDMPKWIVMAIGRTSGFSGEHNDERAYIHLWYPNLPISFWSVVLGLQRRASPRKVYDCLVNAFMVPQNAARDAVRILATNFFYSALWNWTHVRPKLIMRFHVGMSGAYAQVPARDFPNGISHHISLNTQCSIRHPIWLINTCCIVLIRNNSRGRVTVDAWTILHLGGKRVHTRGPRAITQNMEWPASLRSWMRLENPLQVRWYYWG